MDLSGDGINLHNLWSGPGMPFGGSLIMMAFDIVLYGFLAYYLDSVVPSMLNYILYYYLSLLPQNFIFCFN